MNAIKLEGSDPQRVNNILVKLTLKKVHTRMHIHPHLRVLHILKVLDPSLGVSLTNLAQRLVLVTALLHVFCV